MTGKANPKFEQALDFATRVHGAVQQERKGTDFPYVSHPIRVAEILDRFECDDDVIVAGFLHDTIEDAGVTVDEISQTFGPRVASLVEAASEPDKTLPWKDRKEHTIEALREQPDSQVLELVAADKLDNIRSIADTLRHRGKKETWALFSAKESEQHWYYRRVAATLLERNPTSRLIRTLDYETQTVFADDRHTTSFFAGKPFGTPHDARAYLADPIKHWRPDHSALELASSWVGARGIPAVVGNVLASCSTYAGCRFIEAFFEREVDLGTRGRPSQTDLLVLVGLGDGYGVIAVEGKAREPFGKLVADWNDGPGKQARLDGLCAQLGLDASAVRHLRYQLLHRTVSALLEAHRYDAKEALMLVHSFGGADHSLDAYREFAESLGLTNAVSDGITSSTVLEGVTLRLGWVSEPVRRAANPVAAVSGRREP